MKFIKEDIEITENNPNHFNLLEREGFKKAEEDDEKQEDIDEEKLALLEKAKEMGLKVSGNMKIETIIAKIEEAEEAEKAKEE